MADEFRHADVVSGRITENEYESISEHIFNSQAAGDLMLASSPTQLSRLGRGTRGIPGSTIVVAANNSLGKSLADYICDNTADEVEINAALAVTTAAGGGKVQLLDGTYTIAAAINLRNNTLSGVGYQTVLKCADATSVNVIEYTCVDEERPVVEFLSIDGNKAAQADGGDENNQNGIYVVSGSHIHPRITFHDLYIDACKKNGIRMRNTLAFWGQGHLIMRSVWSMHNGSNGMSMYYCEDSIICSCGFGGNEGHGILGEGLKEVVISDNELVGNGVGGVKSGADLNGLYIVVSNNVIESNTHSGIYLKAYSSLIEGNTIEDNGLWGILVQGGNRTIIIEGNLINNNSLTVPNAKGGITLGDACYDIIVQGNIVSNANHKYGVRLGDGCYDCTIKGNRLTQATTANFSAHAGAYDNVIYESHNDIFMDVLAVSATHIRSNEDLSAGLPITFTIDAQPDVPRTLSGHFDAHGNITAYTIAIVGIDAKGDGVIETLTDADGWDWETDNAFATITSITMSARTGTGVGDTMDIGITDVLGLSNIIYGTSDVYKIKKNNANAVVAAAQVNTTYNTYDMSVITLAGADDFTIWFKTNLNTLD